MGHGVGHRLTVEEGARIVHLYGMGASSETLAHDFGVSGVAVRKLLARRGVARRDARACHRTCTLNESVFDSITPCSAYWIGMLMADGYMGAADNSVSLQLKADDRGHVEKFRVFLGSTHVIRSTKKNTAVSLSVKSPLLFASLGKYGVIPNKSLIAEAVPELGHDRDYWRGLIDGDGSIQHYNTTRCPRLSLVGSEQMIRQFAAFCAPYLDGYPLKTSLCGHSPVWYATMHGNAAMTMLRVLYTGATTYLDRKKVAADQLLQRYAGRTFRTLKRYDKTLPTAM